MARDKAPDSGKDKSRKGGSEKSNKKDSSKDKKQGKLPSSGGTNSSGPRKK